MVAVPGSSGFAVVRVKILVVGCCDLVVWVIFCWINDSLGDDLGLGVMGYCD